MTTTTQSEAAVFRDAIAVLRDAHKLLERGWCQGSMARDGSGTVVASHDKQACSWCASGALRTAASAATAIGDRFERTDALDKARWLLRRETGAVYISEWNDAPGRTQAEVLAAVDRAAALGEQELAELEGGER